jgi:hypothetical protein
MTDLRNRCFKLVQQIVTLRDPRCQRCRDLYRPVSGHHVLGRKNLPFNTEGCLALCHECHDGWARKYPFAARELLIHCIGNDRYSALAAEAAKIKRLRGDDLLEIATGLGKELADLKEKVKEE